MLKSSCGVLCDLCLCERIVFKAPSWKVCSFKCITWDTNLHAGQGFPQEKVPAGDVRISHSLSCNTEFPSIMFISMLLACPVENAWKCGTNGIVSPWPWSKGFVSWWTGQLCWATVNLVLMDQWFHCLVFCSLLATVWSSGSDLYKGWIGGSV